MIVPSTCTNIAVVAGEHVTRDQRLADRQEVALLLPVSGG